MALETYRRTLRSLAATRGGARLYRLTLPTLDRVALKVTRGRRNFTDHVLPTLTITTTGAVSGLPRTQPLCYVRDGEDLVVVGTNWGQEQHPAWTGNLLTRPHATVNIGGAQTTVNATLVEGDERERLYRMFEQLAPNYTAYRDWAGDRVPRLFRLTPA